LGHGWSVKFQVYHPLLLPQVLISLFSAIIALLVFDVTSLQSFESIARWMDEIRTQAHEHIRIVIVGNKIDAVEKRVVDRNAAQEYAAKLKVPYF
jgi:GTPase SAR1 family protein